jgi:D-alanine-D-alanine ligase
MTLRTRVATTTLPATEDHPPPSTALHGLDLRVDTPIGRNRNNPRPDRRLRAPTPNRAAPTRSGPSTIRRRGLQPLDIAIAFDLKESVAALVPNGSPDDALEEYDSLDTVQAIANALEAVGHRTRLVGGGRDFVRSMLDSPADLVFNIAEGWGTRSREAHVPSFLEMLGVPFTHSDPLTLALSLDKGLAKRVVSSHGVATPRFAVVSHVRQLAKLDLRFPVVAKPVAEGSSMGIRDGAIFDSLESLTAALPELRRAYRQAVLLEEFCSGPEFTVGIVGTGPDAEVIGVMEIAPRDQSLETFLYSLDVKRNWRERVVYHAPPKRDAKLVRDIGKLALGAYRALECRDVGRVDVRLGADGKPYFLEVNPLPGLNPVSGDLVLLAAGHDISYPALIQRIVNGARKRLSL